MALSIAVENDQDRLCCRTCRAIYRSGFMRCPADGTELTAFDTDPMVGVTLAQHYVIEECIGEGAMGRVYRAHHSRLERRLFAVKVLLGDLASDPTMRKRFAQEAQAASRLDHPNVVGVLDYGETPEALLYIVMDLVAGQNLADVIDAEGPMPERRVIDIARPLCLGLGHAHDHDLVHRDFKPDNVVMIDGDRGPTPRILDFGLAIIADPSEAGTRLTQAGLVMGTPAYTSPEQAMAKPLDHRADLFALGVSLYEMLAGQLPFDGNVMEIVYANTKEEPPPIAERSPGAVVSPEMEAIVRKLMAKKPEDRFASARAVLAALDAVPAISAPSAGLVAPIGKKAIEAAATQASAAMPETVESLRETHYTGRRSRRGLVFGIVALLGIGVGAGGIYWASTRDKGEPTAASSNATPGAAAPTPSAGPVEPARKQAPAAKDDLPPALPAATEDPPVGEEPPASDEPTGTRPTAAKRRRAARKAKARDRKRRRADPPKRAASAATDVAPPPAPTPKPVAPPIRRVIPVAPPPPRIGAHDRRKPTPVTPKPKPVLDASASITGFSARGSLSRTIVRRAVDRVSSSFRGCYRSAARRAKRDSAGTAKVTFKIDESGRARSVSVGNGPLPGIAGCVRSAVGRVRSRIAPDVGTVRVSFSIRFTPRKR